MTLALAWTALAAPAAAVTFAPVADTYVGDGSEAGAVFGSRPELRIEAPADGGRTREAALRFDLTSFAGSVHRARLRLHGSSSADGFRVVAHGSRNLGWTEAATAWTSRPYADDLAWARVAVRPIPGWHEWDVTPYVAHAVREGRASVTFILRAPGPAGAAEFRSREAGASRPQLVIEAARSLLVVANASLAAGDAALRARLERAGYAVTVKTGAEVTSGDAAGQSLVVLSATNAPEVVADKLRDVPVGVLVAHPRLFASMKMTGTAACLDFGDADCPGATPGTSVDIVDERHALAGGRPVGAAGVVTIASGLGWGTPAGGARTIASLPGDRTRSTVFAYEAGAPMAGLNAPARRVGLFLDALTPDRLTPDGATVTDAALQWTAGAAPFLEHRVLLIGIDPLIEADGPGRRLHSHWPTHSWWSDPAAFGRALLSEMTQASGGSVRFVPEFVAMDDWPAFRDGFRYSDAEYIAAYDEWARSGDTRLFHSLALGSMDDDAILDRYDVDARISGGTLDGVMILAPRFLTFYESFMAGPSPYYVNGPPRTRPGTRNYVVMGLEYSRDTGAALHAFMHRSEFILRHVYGNHFGTLNSGVGGNWGTHPYRACLYDPAGAAPCDPNDPIPALPQVTHHWDRFTLVDGIARTLRQSGSTAWAGVGAAHFAPSAQALSSGNYNWGQSYQPALPAVRSTADDWLFNFPALSGETRIIDATEWAPLPVQEQQDYERFFMRWLLHHMPRATGRHLEGPHAILSNWWRYVVEHDRYEESRRESRTPTPTPTARPTTTPTPRPSATPAAVLWTRLVQSSASGATLTKTGTNSAYDSGAISTQSIASGDAYVEFTTPGLGHRTAGFGVGDSSQHYSDVDFAIFTRGDGSFNVMEKGSVLSAGGGYAAGDLFRVEIVAGIARYYRNGALVHTSVQGVAYPLVVDTALYTPGVQIGNARLGTPSAGTPTPSPTVTPTATPPPPTPTPLPRATATPTPGASPTPATVMWTNLVQASASAGTLTKTGSEPAYDAGAISVQSIASGDGYVEFTTPNFGHRTAGFGVGDTGQHYGDVDFAIFTRGDGSYNVMEKGSVLSAGGSYAAGDLFRIEILAGIARYYRNGALVHTSTQAVAYPLVVDTALYTPGVQVGAARIGISAAATPAPRPTATPTTAPTAVPTSTPLPGATPTPGASPTPVTVTWTNLVQASASAGTLTKTGSESAYDSGAISTQAIASGDGYVELTTPGLGHRTMGLGVGDTSQHYSDVDFAIFTRGDGSYNVMEKGSVRSAGGSYTAGDLFRIEIAAGVVRYYRNGALVHTSTQAVAYPLVVDTALYTPGVQVGGARMGIVTAPMTPTPTPTAAPTAAPTPTPGTAPTPVAVTWVNLVQASASLGTLTKTGSVDAYDSGASSLQSIASGDGYAEFTVPALGYRTAGLGVGDSNPHYSDVDFAIFTRSDGSYNVMEKGSVRSAGGSYAPGDIFRIEITGGIVRYRRNGTLVYSSTQPIDYPLIVDTALYTPGAQVGDAKISR